MPESFYVSLAYHNVVLRLKQLLTAHVIFVILLAFNRNLFPGKPELLEELLERTGLDSTVRPQEVGFEDYGKICRSFIEMSREHDLSVTPLRVRKPVPIATEKDKDTDANASDVSNASNTSDASDTSDASNASNTCNASNTGNASKTNNASNVPVYRTSVTNV